MMNRRGQVFGFFVAGMFVLFYLYAWIFIFGPFLAQFGTELAVSQGMTGLEGFVWRTMNIWAGFVPLVLYIIAKGVFGGNG